MSFYGEKAMRQICLRGYACYFNFKRLPVAALIKVFGSSRKNLVSTCNAGYSAKVCLAIGSNYGDMLHAGKGKVFICPNQPVIMSISPYLKCLFYI